MAWTPKLFGLLLFFFFFGFEGCNSTNLTHVSSGPKANPEGKDVCNPPFQPVGDTCLLIDNAMRGTWSDMRDVCLGIGGDLVNLQDANILYEISQYIKLKGMDDVSYWVGATDEAEEGKWVWSSDGSDVRRKAPLWGLLYGYQPDGGQDQNCGVLYDRDFFYLHDESCEDSIYGFICQPTPSGELKTKGDRGINTKFIESTNDCPYPYERVGNTCLRVFPENNYTWSEAKNKCGGANEHLVKIDDANFLGLVNDYLSEKETNGYIWIGGSDEASEDQWVWHDATPIKRGTPYWDVVAVYHKNLMVGLRPTAWNFTTVTHTSEITIAQTNVEFYVSTTCNDPQGAPSPLLAEHREKRIDLNTCQST